MIKYIEISNQIRDKIKDGTYQPAERIPYEHELCDIYHCHKETMKKALDILVKEGLLIRKRGAGTFVKSRNVYDKSPRLLNYRLNMIESLKNQVLQFEVIPCHEDIAKKLEIEKEDFVYHLLCLQSIENEVIGLEDLYIPIFKVPRLHVKDVECSLYDYVKHELGLEIQYIFRQLKGVLSTSLEQQYLGLKELEPCIQIHKTSYLSDGSILEYRVLRLKYRYFDIQVLTILS